MYALGYFHVQMSSMSDIEARNSTSRSTTQGDPLLRHLAKDLRAARLRRGLSQQGLASSAGLTRLRVVEIERGSSSVAIDAYVKAARAMGFELGLVAYRRPVFEELDSLFK
jgi:HTH-type transcriptional regulator/antitoxin HipB